MNFVFQISGFNDINKIRLLVDYLSGESCGHKIIILIHINMLSPVKLHDEVSSISRKNADIHIIKPIITRWSHITHVYQKFAGIKYLHENDINYNYYVNITESDIPIKPLSEVVKFIAKNVHVSYFFDYSDEYKITKQYYELIEGLKNMKRITKSLQIISNEISFSKYSLEHKWRWYLCGRNINHTEDWSSMQRLTIKSLRMFLVSVYAFPIIRFIISPNLHNYIAAQKWQFGKKIKESQFPSLKMYSEWQFSITSFFSFEYAKFIFLNFDKYIGRFEEIYAPDESFWITIAKNFNESEVGECVFTWKPMILGLETSMSSKNNTRIKLGWDYNSINSIKLYSSSNELFARKANSLEHMIQVMKLLNVI